LKNGLLLIALAPQNFNRFGLALTAELGWADVIQHQLAFAAIGLWTRKNETRGMTCFWFRRIQRDVQSRQVWYDVPAESILTTDAPGPRVKSTLGYIRTELKLNHVRNITKLLEQRHTLMFSHFLVLK
jgi:hypothetical protein